MAATTGRPARRALLIGIDHYPKLVAQDLRGCVRDTQAARELLVNELGFAQRDVTHLIDEQATRRGILDALDALAAAAGRDDQVVVYYAGHGSRVREQGGGWYESIVPYDSGRGRQPCRDIFDHELAGWLRGLTDRTGFVTLLFDCCHSGAIVRGPAERCRARGVEADERPVSGPAGRALERGASEPRVLLAAPSERYVYLGACGEQQKAFEMSAREGSGEVVHGVMSYYLLRALRQRGAAETYRELFERVAPEVTREAGRLEQEQHPRWEGALDREVLGTAVRRPALVSDAERRARWEAVRGLRRPGSALSGQVEVGLLRRRDGERWEEAARGAEGAVLASAGDYVTLLLRSRASVPVYVTVLWLGMGQELMRLWPPRGGQHLAPGAEAAYGGWTLALPKGLRAGEAGRDLLKVLVAPREVDFGPLLVGGEVAETGDWAADLQEVIVRPRG